MDYNNANNGMNMMNPNNSGQGMPMQGAPNQGMPGQRMPMQGAPNQGMPGQRMPMQGAPNQGMPGQRMPMQGAPNQGMPGQRMPMQGVSNQGMPGQRMPMQGAPNQRIAGQRAPGNASAQQGTLQRRFSTGGANETGSKSAFDTDNGPDSRKSRLFDNEENKGRNGGFTLPHGFTAGISGFTGYIYGGILLLCLVIALVAYGRGHHGTSGKKYSIPTDMITYTGIFRNIYEKAASGTLGSSQAGSGVLYDDDGTEVPAAPTAIGEEPGSGYASGAGGTSTAGDGSASGATMALDSGEGTANFSQAESYKELLTQVESAIASGDTDFIGRKFAYEDEDGNLKGYPQSVIDHFVTYMSTNSDKRSALMAELESDKYQGQNEDAFVVKLPYIKFVVNMGYDNTTISLPGFSDQIVNAGQSADIAPLLPCMYTLTISNPEWSEPVTRDIEANVNEATISINIKP